MNSLLPYCGCDSETILQSLVTFAHVLYCKQLYKELTKTSFEMKPIAITFILAIISCCLLSVTYSARARARGPGDHMNPSCVDNFVLRNGQCVCPEDLGFILRGYRCERLCAANEVFTSGVCQCSKGYERKSPNAQCTPVPPQSVRCIGNFVMRQGKCVCPTELGFSVKGTKCLYKAGV